MPKRERVRPRTVRDTEPRRVDTNARL